MSLSALLWLLVASLAVTSRATTAADEYTIHMHTLAARRLEVSAELTVRDSTLCMRHSVWSAHLPDRWATWIPSQIVRYRVVGDKDWRALDYLGDARWDASHLLGRRIQLRYVVRLEHDQADWPYGLKESTYVTDDMVHAVGMSLFVYSPSMEGFGVSFDVPGRWRVVSPWDRKDNAGRAYSASGSWQLVNSVLAFGSMTVYRTTLGAAEVLIALSGDLANDSAAAGALLDGVATEATTAFGSAPTRRFAIIVGRGDASGGGAFYRSFSMLTRSSLGQERVEWKRTLAHELVHMWIGTNGIRTAGPEEEWFKEGFTSYYTALLLARGGLVTQNQFLAELYRLWKMHRGDTGPPLDEAGSAEHRWYDHLYGGGAVVALCLDVRLRANQPDSATLDGLMKRLAARFSDGEAPLSNAALVDAVTARGGQSIGAWLETSIQRPREIRVDDCLRWLGVEERGFLWARRLVPGDGAPSHRYERWSRSGRAAWSDAPPDSD